MDCCWDEVKKFVFEVGDEEVEYLWIVEIGFVDGLECDWV